MAPTELENRQRMEKLARLAHKGLYECFRCRKVDDQLNGVVVAFAGAILLAICPECMDGPIMINRLDGGFIQVQMPRPSDNLVVLAGDVAVADVAAATPDVKKYEVG